MWREAVTVLGLNNCIWGWDLPQVGSRGQENGSVGEWQCAVNPCEIPGLSSHNCFHGLQCFGGHCGVFWAFPGFSLAGSGQPQPLPVSPEVARCTSKPSAVYFILAKNDLGIKLRKIINNLPQPGGSCSLLCGVSQVVMLQFYTIKTS